MSRDSRAEREIDVELKSGGLNNVQEIYNDLNLQKLPQLLDHKMQWQLEPAPLPALDLTDLKNPILLASADIGPEKGKEKSDQQKEQDALNAGLYGEFGKGNELKAISPDACIQPANLGNCYFVAALAAKAQVDPQGLKDMIKENQDGTFTVTFPGLNKSYTVAKPSSEDIQRIDGYKDVVSKYGTWPLVVMKALGEHYKPGSGIDGLEGGSLFSAGMKALNKDQVQFEGIGSIIPLMSSNDLHERLMQKVNPAAKNDAVPVTASASMLPKNGEIVAGHVYTVMKYEPDANDVSKSKVTVRNPGGDKDAIKTMSLADFQRDFVQMSYPQKDAPVIPFVGLVRPFLKGHEVNYDDLLKRFLKP